MLIQMIIYTCCVHSPALLVVFVPLIIFAFAETKTYSISKETTQSRKKKKTYSLVKGLKEKRKNQIKE